MIVYFLDHFTAFSFIVIYPINTTMEKVLKATLVAGELWLILPFYVLR